MTEHTEQKETDCTLDEALERLDALLARMEEENSLEETFRMYHQGVDLLKVCSDKIDRIEKQVQVLDEEGNLHEF